MARTSSPAHLPMQGDTEGSLQPGKAVQSQRRLGIVLSKSESGLDK